MQLIEQLLLPYDALHCVAPWPPELHDAADPPTPGSGFSTSHASHVVEMITLPPAQALWRWEIADYYTGGCGTTLTHVGWRERDCDGIVSSNGTLSGKWKVVRWMNCVTYEEGTNY